MKRIAFFLFILLSLVPTVEGRAQEMAKTMESLVVDFWPDYDRPSALVLLTGTLPAGTKLPVGVSLPFPDKATLNAVARIDGKDGVMKDDVFSTPSPGAMMFITPDLRFRLEYYLPYTVNGNQKSFDFTWLADLSVDNFLVRVQQPLGADLISMKPSAGNVVRGEDGFDYHTFPSRTVRAGESFSLHVDYIMTRDQLSAERLSTRKLVSQAPESTSSSPSGSVMNGPLVAVLIGGLLIVLSLFGYFVARRSSSAAGKPPTGEADPGSPPASLGS